MACCGDSTASRSGRPADNRSYGGSSGSTPLVAYFRNSGASGITAVGPVSGRLYRFPSSGQAVAVEARDAALISRVPHLQNIKLH
jgi:hypothetical protein